MKEFFFNFIGFSLLGAVAIVLIIGIYTLLKVVTLVKNILIVDAA